MDKKDTSDPFVDVKLGKARLVKTSVILNDLNPVWNETYRIEVCHFADHLIFEVRDKDHAYSELMGSVQIDCAVLVSGAPMDGWFDIKKKSGKCKGQLKLKLAYRSAASMAKTYNVDCYFPMRENCKVTLYQVRKLMNARCTSKKHSFIHSLKDAHAHEEMPLFATMERPDGVVHKPRSCWKDMYGDLMQAQQVICITGWAVWDKLQLFRGDDLAIDRRTLGEILTDKAEQGVRVYVMVWSEKTSNEFKEQGFMGTHDMETFNYFKNTKVTCALAPRYDFFSHASLS